MLLFQINILQGNGNDHKARKEIQSNHAKWRQKK